MQSAAGTPRPAIEVLDEASAIVAARPKLRMHLNPGAVIWISVSLGHLGISRDVELVPDDSCPMGLMYLEN